MGRIELTGVHSTHFPTQGVRTGILTAEGPGAGTPADSWRLKGVGHLFVPDHQRPLLSAYVLALWWLHREKGQPLPRAVNPPSKLWSSM